MAEGLDRAIGIKRGPRILGLAIVGILLGGLLGGGLALVGMWRDIQLFAESADGAAMPDYPLDAFLLGYAPSVLIALVATMVGAYARLRRL